MSQIAKCQKLLRLESVRIGKCQNRKVLETAWFGKCQNWKVSETAWIGKYQKLLRLESIKNGSDWKVLQLESVRNCSGWKVSEFEIYQNRKVSETAQIGKCQNLKFGLPMKMTLCVILGDNRVHGAGVFSGVPLFGQDSDQNRTRVGVPEDAHPYPRVKIEQSQGMPRLPLPFQCKILLKKKREKRGQFKSNILDRKKYLLTKI